jgi:DNA-binding NarL/FixJ family response regulator
MPEPLRLVLADDHPVFREGLRTVVEASDRHVLVGEAADGLEAVAVCVTERPDVVLMDLHMPGLNGVEATERLRTAAPEVAVVVLTMVEDPASVSAALRAGARGYLLKGATPREVLSAVDAAAAGQSVLDSGIASALLAGSAPPPLSGPFAGLSEREVEVVRLLARGEDNAGIAGALFLSPKTVRNYVSAILTKTGCATRGQLMVQAREHGLAGTG